jgi:hypothetical protein
VHSRISEDQSFNIFCGTSFVAKIITATGHTDFSNKLAHTNRKLGITTSQAPILDWITGKYSSRVERPCE